MIVFSRGKITIQSHHLAAVMSSAVANVVCASLIFIQQTAMRQKFQTDNTTSALSEWH